MSITVVMADDHPVVRVGIAGVLGREADIQVVGEAVTGDEALRLTSQLLPEVLLLDINMPGLKAVTIVRQIQALPVPTRVLVMTSFSDPGIVQTMMKAGACGYLVKDEAPAMIVEAVRAVAGGQVWFSPSLQPVIAGMGGGGLPDSPLTERELEVARLVAQGMPNKEIAFRAEVTERTVEYYLTQIYRKLNLTSRVDVAHWVEKQDICGS